MAAAAEHGLRARAVPAGRAAVETLRVLGVAAAAAAAGVVVVAIATRISYDAAPYVVLLLVGLPVLAAVALRRPWVAVCGVLAVFPLANITLLPSLQLVDVTVFAAAAAVAVRRLSRAETLLPWSPELWWALALLAWALVALPRATDEVLAGKQIAQLVAAIVFTSTVLAACRTLADARRLIGALAVIAVVVVGVGIVSGNTARVHQQFGGETVQGRLTGSFTQPNQLGSFCALALLVVLGLVFGARSRRGRMLAAVAAAVILAGLLLSYSRGAWIGLAVGALYFLARVPAARRALLALAVPVVVLASVTGSYAGSRPEIQVIQLRAETITARSPYDSRSTIWSEAWREALASPITGVGPGNFPVASTRAASQASDVSAAHAHNIWLNWAAEAGFPATVLIAGLVVAVGAAARRASRGARAVGDGRSAAILAGLVAALISVLMQGMVDYTLRNAVNLYAVWSVIGLVLVYARELRVRAG